MDNIALALQAPFDPFDIEWRSQQAGAKNNKPWAMVLAYVTNRAIMTRLDEVFGPLGWQNEYRDINGGKGVECGISVYNATTNQWVTKWDAADTTQVEATKGGRSGSMKRAAVQWGIGRYLYNLEATFATCAAGNLPNNARAVKTKFKGNGCPDVYGYFLVPALPDWAMPQQVQQTNAGI